MQFVDELWSLRMSLFRQCIDMSKKGMNHDIIERPKYYSNTIDIKYDKMLVVACSITFPHKSELFVTITKTKIVVIDTQNNMHMCL